MGKTSYCLKWEDEFSWIEKVKDAPDKAHCILCKKTFSIDKCGVSSSHTLEVISTKRAKHFTRVKELSQQQAAFRVQNSF